MAQNILTLFSFLILFLISQSNASIPPPSKLCKSTPYPIYCAAVLPAGNSSATIYDYGRFSVRKSLSAARKFLALINKNLQKSATSGLTLTATRALQDCQFLAQCNVDNLLNSLDTLNKTSRALSPSRADDIQTLLSATLTNTQTCLDGLETAAPVWGVRNGVPTPLANDTRLFSVSLALFTRGWVPASGKKRNLHPSAFNTMAVRKHLMRDGRLNLKMSEVHRRVYRKFAGGGGGRRLLQDEGGAESQVEVSDFVVVSRDGSGNFTTINDAVSAAPNNTDGSNGYFLIYITAGVYEEYVSIAKNKKYLMMVGAGINETIITGNHSVVDGWTTFNSPTFGIYLFLFSFYKSNSKTAYLTQKSFE